MAEADFLAIPTVTVVVPDHAALFEIVSKGPTFLAANFTQLMAFRAWVLNRKPGQGVGHRQVAGGYLVLITVPKKCPRKSNK